MHCIGSCFGVSFYVGRGRLVLWDSPRKQSTALLRTLARTGVQRPFRGLTRRCHGFGPRSHGLFVDPTLLIVTRGWHRPRQCTRCRVTISGVSQVTDGAGKYIDGLQVKVSDVTLVYTKVLTSRPTLGGTTNSAIMGDPAGAKPMFKFSSIVELGRAMCGPKVGTQYLLTNSGR